MRLVLDITKGVLQGALPGGTLGGSFSAFMGGDIVLSTNIDTIETDCKKVFEICAEDKRTCTYNIRWRRDCIDTGSSILCCRAGCDLSYDICRTYLRNNGGIK